MKNEKLTNRLKNQIYQEMRRQLCNREKEHKLSELIEKTYKEIFLKQYFQSQEDIVYYLENPILFKSTFIYLSPEDFDIILDSSKVRSSSGFGRRRSEFSVGVELPLICDFEKDSGFGVELIKNQGIYESFRNLYKEYIRTHTYNETCCDEYFIRTNKNCYFYSIENFCRPCTTTKQLKEQFPEVYHKYYLEIKRWEGKSTLTPEKKIEELRKKLGYLSKIKKQQKS